MDRYKDAKQPLTPLAGPYGHPLHPLLVTVPIGAWVSSAAFDFIGAASEDEWAYAIGAKRLIDIGIVSASGAAVFGLMDFLQIPQGTKAWYTGLLHMGLNVGALGMFVLNSRSRGRHIRGRDPGASVTAWQKAMSVSTCAALAASGWLGGMMTYRYGVRVADDAFQKRTGYQSDLETPQEYRTREPLPR